MGKLGIILAAPVIVIAYVLYQRLAYEAGKVNS